MLDYLLEQDRLTLSAVGNVALALALVWALYKRGDITFIKLNDQAMFTLCWLGAFLTFCFITSTCSVQKTAVHRIDVENRVVKTCDIHHHSICVEDSP